MQRDKNTQEQQTHEEEVHVTQESPTKEGALPYNEETCTDDRNKINGFQQEKTENHSKEPNPKQTIVQKQNSPHDNKQQEFMDSGG